MGQSDLSQVQFPMLDPLAAVLVARRQLLVRLEGHADSAPMKEGGTLLDLSTSRAARVAEYLVRMGVLDQQLCVVGRGAQLPVASNETLEGRAQNRRVEVHILRKESQQALREMQKTMGPGFALASALLKQLRYMAFGCNLELDGELRKTSAEVLGYAT